MLLEQQIEHAVDEIIAKQREIDRLRCLNFLDSVERGELYVLEDEVRDVELDIACARRWLSMCGMPV